MSDEFIKVATEEVNEELNSISSIIEKCQNDDDISKNATTIETHMHKIKGLAPMMGKEEIGKLAKTLDFILKKLISGQKVDGFFVSLSTSVGKMKDSLNSSQDLTQIQNEISRIESEIKD